MFFVFLPYRLSAFLPNTKTVFFHVCCSSSQLEGRKRKDHAYRRFGNRRLACRKRPRSSNRYRPARLTCRMVERPKGRAPAFATATVAELKRKLDDLEAAEYSLAFVDTPPAIAQAISAVISRADLVLIPTRPSPHDLRAVGSTVVLVQEQGKPFAFVVTQAKPNTRLTVQAMAALSAHGPVAPAIIHDRVDYAASMIDGRAVQETDPNGRGAAEVGELWEFVHERLHGSKKARKEETA